MDKRNEQHSLKSVGYDDLIEDIFGLNVRGFKSIFQSFINPKEYFDAAWDNDWHNKFTPSFRLWFSLLALTFFLQFFWAGSNSGVIDSYTAQIQAAIDAGSATLPQSVTTRDAAITYGRWYFGVIPFFSALFYGILGLCFVFWGRKIPAIIRIRYVFISVIPAAILTLLVYLALPLVPTEKTMLYLVTVGTASWLIIPITLYRGAFDIQKRAPRIWRTTLFTLFYFIALITTIIAASVFAIKGIQTYYG